MLLIQIIQSVDITHLMKLYSLICLLILNVHNSPTQSLENEIWKLKSHMVLYWKYSFHEWSAYNVELDRR